MDSIQRQQNDGGEEDFLFAMQLATGSMLPMAMQVAIELNVFEIIAKAGPGAQMTSVEIVHQFSTQNTKAPEMLDRILRLLASYSILTATVEEHPDGAVRTKYGLGSVCKYFVGQVSLAGYLSMNQGKIMMDTWYHVKDSIVNGGTPFQNTHGMHVFDYAQQDLRFNHIFNRAMFDITTLVMEKVVEVYKGFEELTELTDVGGGTGTSLAIITSKYPALKGVNFDLPHVIQHAPSYNGVEHVAGDMFEKVPNSQNIFMKHVLHDWDDEHCLKLLKNCCSALSKNGKMIVVDGILPVPIKSDTRTKDVFQFNAIMLTQADGGKERTEKQFDNLVKEAGFAYWKKICCVYNFWLMEFYI